MNPAQLHSFLLILAGELDNAGRDMKAIGKSCQHVEPKIATRYFFTGAIAHSFANIVRNTAMGMIDDAHVDLFFPKQKNIIVRPPGDYFDYWCATCGATFASMEDSEESEAHTHHGTAHGHRVFGSHQGTDDKPPLWIVS